MTTASITPTTVISDPFPLLGFLRRRVSRGRSPIGGYWMPSSRDNYAIYNPAWPDVLLPRQSRPGDRSRLQSDIVFIILGSALVTRSDSLTLILIRMSPRRQENRKSPISIVSEIQFAKVIWRGTIPLACWNTSRLVGFTDSRQVDSFRIFRVWRCQKLLS